MALFSKERDYAAFEELLEQTGESRPMRVCAYCLMPNHWHFVLWPREDDELTGFLRWLTHTHTMRWHVHHGTRGTGHLYQGRFKSFPVQTDEHFYAVVRYVERNPLRAGLVERPDQWRWSSAWRRSCGDPQQKALLAPWPLAMPSDWLRQVRQPQTEAELEAVRQAVRRGSPYGRARWQKQTAIRLGTEFTLRPRGRPKKPPR